MKFICIFSISLFFGLGMTTLWSQESQKNTSKDSTVVVAVVKDTTYQTFKDRYGLRLGLDIYRLGKTFVESDYRSFELVADYRISNNYYVAVEMGNEETTIDDDRVNFTTSGSYIKAGIDINLYENWLDMDNMVYMGFRYAFSTFSQQINTYRIYNTHQYFGENPPVVSGLKYDGLTAQWLEVVLGVKAELFRNFYGGFSLRIHRLISKSEPDNFQNLRISGFNRTTDGSSFGTSFNYTLTYLIPLYKKAPKKK
jgi:hypothetical protein